MKRDWYLCHRLDGTITIMSRSKGQFRPINASESIMRQYFGLPLAIVKEKPKALDGRKLGIH